MKKKEIQPEAPIEVVKPAQKPGHHLQQGPSKTFQQDGHWIEKPNKTAILVCECSNKYLKTRAGQEKCLRCLSMLAR